MNPKLIYHPEVKAALENKKPLVALESTVISHGLPYPLTSRRRTRSRRKSDHQARFLQRLRCSRGQCMLDLMTRNSS